MATATKLTFLTTCDRLCEWLWSFLCSKLSYLQYTDSGFGGLLLEIQEQLATDQHLGEDVSETGVDLGGFGEKVKDFG